MKKHMYKITYDVKMYGTIIGKRLYCEADTAKEAKEFFKRKYNGNCFYHKDRHAFHVEVERADDEIITKQHAIIIAD